MQIDFSIRCRDRKTIFLRNNMRTLDLYLESQHYSLRDIVLYLEELEVLSHKDFEFSVPITQRRRMCSQLLKSFHSLFPIHQGLANNNLHLIICFFWHFTKHLLSKSLHLPFYISTNTSLSNPIGIQNNNQLQIKNKSLYVYINSNGPDNNALVLYIKIS